jgi:hypothetical protein
MVGDQVRLMNNTGTAHTDVIVLPPVSLPEPFSSTMINPCPPWPTQDHRLKRRTKTHDTDNFLVTVGDDLLH